MAKGKNCPNCGAVYEPEKNKCPYCGTSYFDMTAINIPAREPFYLKVKAEMGGTPIYITQKVIADINHGASNIIFTQEETHAQRAGSTEYISSASCQCTTNLSFIAIPDEKGNLLTIELAEE